MPQIWLTYDEVGAFLGCSPTTVREDAAEAGWSRRRGPDGLTRVKLPPATAFEYTRSAASNSPLRVEAGANAQVALLRAALTAADRKSPPGKAFKAA